MKKLLLVCCAVIGISAASFAQGGGRPQRSPEEQTAQLKTAVALTDAQEAKVLAIYKLQAASIDSLNKAVPDPQTARPLRMPIQQRYRAMITAVLTPEQVAKMPAGRGGGNGGGGGTPPPPQR